jgi:hypothetical protein
MARWRIKVGSRTLEVMRGIQLTIYSVAAAAYLLSSQIDMKSGWQDVAFVAVGLSAVLISLVVYFTSVNAAETDGTSAD